MTKLKSEVPALGRAAPTWGRSMSAARQDAYLPRGPRTLTSKGARPALLLSTVKDCKMWARMPELSPGPVILTLLGSTTSFTGTLKGLPGKEVTGF